MRFGQISALGALLSLFIAGGALAQSSPGTNGALGGSGDTPGSPGAHIGRHRTHEVVHAHGRYGHHHRGPAISPYGGQPAAGPH
ncbi:hypothetical protein DES32_1504 [Methylovirgula ligni]|uniref:Uncharacterized protein n=1 Tax=Methylovirgula ligni TaxID=569860 RepID=A0A3D9YYU1_9HYPH|nr:hypothetical protein DES32_1504 [Methylovirgula ligni]